MTFGTQIARLKCFGKQQCFVDYFCLEFSPFSHEGLPVFILLGKRYPAYFITLEVQDFWLGLQVKISSTIQTHLSPFGFVFFLVFQKEDKLNGISYNAFVVQRELRVRTRQKNNRLMQ